MSEGRKPMITLPQGGAELTIAAMEDYDRMEIGRKTYRFAREVMRDPELRARVKARAQEIRELGLYRDCHTSLRTTPR